MKTRFIYLIKNDGTLGAYDVKDNYQRADKILYGPDNDFRQYFGMQSEINFNTPIPPHHIEAVYDPDNDKFIGILPINPLSF